MMKWLIPAKTFLLGEYAALAGASAIVLTTYPCFELELTSTPLLDGIHPFSPAAIWWNSHHFKEGLVWRDPYEGVGGLGASSAQFIGAYLASCRLRDKRLNYKELMDAYYQSAWSGEGTRPSGYDLLAQSQRLCVYLSRKKNKIQSYPWPFSDLGFLLVHTGKKLSTHTYLKEEIPSYPTSVLSGIVEQAKLAFEKADGPSLVAAINAYHAQLSALDLIAPESLEQIQLLQKDSEDILAIKGCGALGADVLLLIVSRACLHDKVATLNTKGWKILATSDKLYKGEPLIPKEFTKSLEILC